MGQIYDIEILENYLSSQFTEINCSIYQTKLFLIVKKENNETLILQFDLLTMNLEKHYNSNIRMHCYSWDSMMNKNQTLLAIGSYDNCIFSTENGMLISKFDANYKVVRFITLKNNSERLVIRHFVYKIITGDSGSLSPWTFRENPTMTVLLVAFTFFTVIYLMNLFIGLLNLAIGDYNREEEFLLQKARIIMEIELFYMFPFQRYNNKEWFPEWIYYDMPVTEVRKLINAIDNDNKTEFNYYRPIISEKLRKLIAIEDEVISEKSKELVVIEDEDKKEKLNKLENNIKELKQQIDEQNQQMRELLNGIIKGLNIDINNKIEEKK
ncbi:hypothetical protein RhiirC2_567768 [Rhizophagus irregularis]|uniref:Ion transport domain-containing protein n=1 Tax=Rhizophagus irregularis TaxID=588596 RepID=A0A2N1N122_9GLOM|nr:hypothetical protein RhiirC2_567768 [Rhizophagus irregularis]